MLPAVTLVHKAAMPIGVHAVSSFARHFTGHYRLDIHTDGSPDKDDEEVLLRAAAGMEARIVRPTDRKTLLDERLADYPLIRGLADGVGYFAKLELPMAATGSYFYFDSDIVWLRSVPNLTPSSAPNAFSTESWSWYNGIAKDHLWIKAKTPRRVNSGFYYLGEPFPFTRMEDMLAKGMFDPTLRYNTDQEIMAYLFRNMELYDPEDLKRSRRNVRYDLSVEPAAALHFPGGMWKDHLDQIAQLSSLPRHSAKNVRSIETIPLDHFELLRMRLLVKISDAPLLGIIINHIRKIRSKLV